jgi:hypothetical protein
MRSYLHLISYFGAKKAKGKFLLALASDIDLLSFKDKYRLEYKANFKLLIYLTYWLPNDLVYKFLLKRADYVIRQHSGQQVENNSVRGKVVTFPNIVDLQNLPSANKSSLNYFIYVGSLTIMKGADKLYEIISGIHSENKIMVVGQPNDTAAVPIFEQISKLENADVRGRIKHSDTLQLMANAKALINTSENEGFPNVFLEAWPMGVPVLSLKVNPGNVFDNPDLGVCFNGDLLKMKEYINHYEATPGNKEKMRSYVTAFHDFNTAAERFLTMLSNAV